MQSLRTDELADFHLINCNVALNLLDQTAQVRVGKRTFYHMTFYPRVSYLVTICFHFKLTVRIRVRLGSGSELRLGLGSDSELQSGLELRLGSDSELQSGLELRLGLGSELQSEFRG